MDRKKSTHSSLRSLPYHAAVDPILPDLSGPWRAPPNQTTPHHKNLLRNLKPCDLKAPERGPEVADSGKATGVLYHFVENFRRDVLRQ